MATPPIKWVLYKVGAAKADGTGNRYVAPSLAQQAKPVAWVIMLFDLGNGSISSLGEIGKHDRLKICSLWVTGSSPVVSRRSQGPVGGGASLAEPIFALTTGTARPLVIYKRFLSIAGCA